MSPTTAIKLAVGVIQVVSLAIDVADKFVDVLKKAGVIENTRNSDELGSKVLRGREINITPKNVETPSDYENYARRIDSIEIPQDKNYSPEEKRAAADEFISGAMNVKFGKDSGVNNFLQEVNGHPNYYTPDRIEKYMDTAGQNNLNMENIGRYFDNKLDSLQDIRRTESVMTEAEKSLGATESEAKAAFDAERIRRE